MVAGCAGSGGGAGFDAADLDDADDFGRDAEDPGRDDRPELEEPDDGLLLVGSFSVNDLNMGCPIVDSLTVEA
jgi:hypothetical protein